jgi:hypothetical protein
MSTHNQIRIVPNGRWHRHVDDDSTDRTACGELIGSAFMNRDAKLDDNLCGICFTRHEIDTAQTKKLESERQQRDNDPALFHDPDDEPTDPDGDPDAINDAVKATKESNDER